MGSSKLRFSLLFSVSPDYLSPIHSPRSSEGTLGESPGNAGVAEEFNSGTAFFANAIGWIFSGPTSGPRRHVQPRITIYYEFFVRALHGVHMGELVWIDGNS